MCKNLLLVRFIEMPAVFIITLSRRVIHFGVVFIAATFELTRLRRKQSLTKLTLFTSGITEFYLFRDVKASRDARENHLSGR